MRVSSHWRTTSTGTVIRSAVPVRVSDQNWPKTAAVTLGSTAVSRMPTAVAVSMPW